MSSSNIELQLFDKSERDLYIFGEIDDIVSLDFIKAKNNIVNKDIRIFEQNYYSIKQFKEITNDFDITITEYYPPVKIYLNSVGGYCYEAFAIHDAISSLNKHCTTHVIATGNCMSAGITILLSVPFEQRICTKNTTFMIHQVSSIALGKVADLEESVNESKRINELVYNLILKETAITKNELDDNFTKKEDWFISAEKAKELKIVSKII